MNLHKKNAEIFVPDGTEKMAALKRTTHMGIAAHQDDIEIMALSGVKETFKSENGYFTAVVVTDGAGSARAGKYASYSDEEMKNVRRHEQKKAAMIGDYGALILNDFTSGEIKDSENKDFENELIEILTAANPKIIYTHNLADKHESHLGVVTKVIKALRKMPKELHPEKIYGCEVWRDLDWLSDDRKIAFDITDFDNMSAALLGVFDSQIAGGKRYDLAAAGRRRANATYFNSHAVDKAEQLIFGMDLSPLLNSGTDIIDFITSHIDDFKNDVSKKLKKIL